MRRFPDAIALAGVLTIAAARPAEAHLVTTRFGDFYGGMLHPLLGLEYLLPWLALGLLAGLHDARDGRWAVIAFPLGVAAGATLSLLAPSSERLLLGLNVVFFVFIGGLIALALPLTRTPLIGLSACFGVLQGWDNALAIATGTNAGLFAAGIITVSYVVITLLTAATVQVLRRGEWVRIAVRAIGSWITAIGLLTAGVRLFPA